ncbi:hypothetical protein B0H13DRAFT_590108 [Mycena leptocephala]|nr:hypothetical protein B0H13DRAFT_590108 [Mycena leptocephala]
MCCDATVAEPSSIESPWEAILHTNTTPSDSDCRRIQDFLNAPRRAVADLTEEIMRMQNLLDGLTRKRDELSQLIDSHLALVSPARRLPEDVISAIFIACVSSTSNATLDSETAPLLLCQVCSAWRRVALSTPQLWTSLHIPLLSTSKTQDLADIASCWLSRSGVLPLSISLIYTDVHEQSDEPDLSPLASLAKFSLRWKSINMVLPTFRSFESISHLSSDAFPILQTASVGSIKKDPIPS